MHQTAESIEDGALSKNQEVRGQTTELRIAECGMFYDFYGFYDFYDFNDLNDFNGLPFTAYC